MKNANRSCDFCREEKIETKWEKEEGPAWAERKRRRVRRDVKSKLVWEEKGTLSSTDSSVAAENEHEEFMVQDFLEFTGKSLGEK